MGVQGYMTPECDIPSYVGYYCKAGNSRGLWRDSIVAESATVKTNSVTQTRNTVGILCISSLSHPLTCHLVFSLVCLEHTTHVMLECTEERGLIFKFSLLRFFNTHNYALQLN
jgi:hypothetical protein